jgi:hypothetical protein
MTLRWMSLSSGNGKPCCFRNAAWEKGLSPLMASSVAPLSFSVPAAWPRPLSSGLQMLPKSKQ